MIGDDSRSGVVGTLERRAVRGAAIEAAAAAGVVRTALSEVGDLAEQQFRLLSLDGSIADTEGRGLEWWLRHQRQKRPHWWGPAWWE